MFITSVAAMKSLNPAPTEEIVVDYYHQQGDGGGGVFIHRAGTAPFIDEGIYIAAAPAAGGYYERVIPGDHIMVSWFGYIPDPDGDGPLTACDDHCQLKKAFDAGGALSKKVVSCKKNYYVDDYLTIKGDVDFNGSTIYFSATSTGDLIEQIAEGDILNLNIDGAGVDNCVNGLVVRANYPVTRMTRYVMRIENLENINVNEACNGAIFVKNSSETNYLNCKYDISISCKNIIARGTGVNGSNAGSSSGLLFSMNCAGTDAQVIIRDLEIDGVGLKKDSLGICFYTLDYIDGGKGQFLIENVVVRNCQKRGIKIQAPNTIVRNATVYGEQTDTCFDTYSSDTQFISCRALNIEGTAFNVAFKDTLIRDCFIATSTSTTNGTLIVARETAERLTIDNVQIRVNKDVLAGQAPVISSLTEHDIYIRNITFQSGNSWSFYAATAPNNVYFDNVIVEGPPIGILIGNVPAVVRINNCHFKNTTYCLTTQSSTEAPAIFYAHNSTFKSNATAVYMKNEAAIAGRLHMTDCKVTGSNGLLVHDNSSIRNTIVENPASTTSGLGIEVVAGQIDGCRITNFERGVEWTGSTLAEFTNNTLIHNTAAFTPSITVTIPYIKYNNTEIP